MEVSQFYGWSNYKRFKEEFQKYDWIPSDKDSLKSVNGDAFLNEVVFNFDGKGMLMKNPIHFYQYSRLIAKKNKQLRLERKKMERSKWITWE